MYNSNLPHIDIQIFPQNPSEKLSSNKESFLNLYWLYTGDVLKLCNLFSLLLSFLLLACLTQDTENSILFPLFNISLWCLKHCFKVFPQIAHPLMFLGILSYKISKCREEIITFGVEFLLQSPNFSFKNRVNFAVWNTILPCLPACF